VVNVMCHPIEILPHIFDLIGVLFAERTLFLFDNLNLFIYDTTVIKFPIKGCEYGFNDYKKEEHPGSSCGF